MEHYEQALQRDPNHRDSLFRLALNHDLNGEDGKAIELYQRCASLNPTCLGVLVNLGVLYEDREQYERAVECYRRVLAIEPNHKRALLFLKDAEASLTMRFDEDRTRRVRAHDESLQMTLANFELSARSRNVLERLGVRSLGDLTRVTEEQLLEFKNFGETSLDEIKDLLARNDLQLAGSQPSAKPIARELPAPTEDGSMVEKLSMPVDLLGLSTRCRKCMERLNITRVGELIQRSEEELLDVRSFGRTSVMEIKSKLAELGLSLKKTEGE
jgi:DNA-directed RNA polymerase subunit alpha